jgi:hypothetical protein
MPPSGVDDGKVPRRVRAYDASRRWFDVFITAARGVFVGTWLGLLDRTALHATDEVYYRRTRMYHDEHYNLSGFFPWEGQALEQYFQGCRSVLVTSAGGGREVVALARRGLAVAAFECHPGLAQGANELLSREGLTARVALAPRDECPSDIPTCDGAIIGWTSYTLMQHASTRVRFLKQLRAHLPNGAPLLVSVFARREALRYLRIVRGTANVLRAIRGRQKAELGDDLVPNFVHHFSEDELAAELEAGGFRLAEFSRVGSPHAVAHAVEAADDPSVRGSASDEEKAESSYGQVTTELRRDAAKGGGLRDTRTIDRLAAPRTL